MGRASTVVKAHDEVVGIKVMNESNETLGSIKELMIDKTSGQVAYVVLESGAILGLGGKLFALPWQVLHFDTNKDCYKANIAKEILEKAPGFDKDHWPDMADRTWGQNLSNYYKTTPY